MFYKLSQQAYIRMRLYDNGKKQMNDQQLVAYINSQFKLKHTIIGIIVD